MSNSLQSVHVKLPQEYYEKLKEESKETGRPMKQIIRNSLELHWSADQNSLTLYDAMVVYSFKKYALYPIPELPVHDYARKLFPDDLVDKAKKIFEKAEEANLIIYDYGYIWKKNSPKECIDQLFENFNWEKWISDLIEMHKEGTLDEMVEKAKKTPEMNRIKNKLLPNLKEKKIINNKNFEKEIREINEKEIADFDYDAYIKELINRYPHQKEEIKTEIAQIMVDYYLGSAAELQKEIHPDKSEKVIREKLTKHLIEKFDFDKEGGE